MLKNMIIYPVNDIYLGHIETLRGDEFINKVEAFHKREDKVDKKFYFEKLYNEAEYYHIKELIPIKTKLSQTDFSMFITKPKIERVVARENQKINVNTPTEEPKIKMYKVA